MSSTKEPSSGRGWWVRGEWIDACNCNIGCPCNFNQPPTNGFCEGLMMWRITKGRFGTVSLDGLRVVALVYSKGHVLNPGKRMGLVIDSRADREQREVLAMIFTGKAGGPLSRFAKIVDPYLGVKLAPIEFSADRRGWMLRITDRVRVEGKPYVGPNTPPGKITKILNAPLVEGGAGQAITVGQSSQANVTDLFGFHWDHSGRSSKYERFEYRGP